MFIACVVHFLKILKLHKLDYTVLLANKHIYKIRAEHQRSTYSSSVSCSSSVSRVYNSCISQRYSNYTIRKGSSHLKGTNLDNIYTNIIASTAILL